MHGVTIRGNDPVVLYYMGANYDDTVFADPHHFDIDRRIRMCRSVEGGPHDRLGVISLSQITVLLEELLSSTTSVERAGDPARLRSSWINGLKHLPVTVAG